MTWVTFTEQETVAPAAAPVTTTVAEPTPQQSEVNAAPSQPSQPTQEPAQQTQSAQPQPAGKADDLDSLLEGLV